MKRLRLRGSTDPETCSADTKEPRMTMRSTPASTTVRQWRCVWAGLSRPATTTPEARIWLSRSVMSSDLTGAR